MRKNLPYTKNRLQKEQGQSLILAIIVMFLLVFIGIIFVVLVARNQGRAGRSKDVLAAQYMAESGIQYADNMLRSSEEGADWRPIPDNLPETEKDHPDFLWLRPYAPVDTAVGAVPNATGPTGGYTSFSSGQGRYLLRVSYNPNPEDPLSKYIRIDCVGRMGIVDRNDPTTWGVSTRLRRELTAYKPIGITDYCRFITNRENRATEATLGAEGFVVRYGNESTGGEGIRGAPIYANCDLTWYGDVHIVLRGRSYDSTSGSGIIPIDAVSVAGKIRHQMINGNPSPVSLTEVILTGSAGTINDRPMQPTDGGAHDFTTLRGFYRDSSSYPDSERYARGITRIDPPDITADDTPTNVPRYVALTRDSGKWIQAVTASGTQSINTGRYGWGRGVYIDNFADLQPESETLFGGYTPRGDWMKPNNRFSSLWQGPYYVPPGVLIVLYPGDDTDNDTTNDPYITITRTDVVERERDPMFGKKSVWRDPAGNPMHDTGATLKIPYPQGTQTFPFTQPDGTVVSLTLDRNGVIYAEGNVRIRGMLGKGKQLTVVSGGIIYVDGNVLKYRDKDHPDVVDRSSAIALLAKSHVCLNTTQFVSMLNSAGPASIGSDSGTGKAPFHRIITPDPATTFFATASLAPPTGTWQVDQPLKLFVRHAGQYGPAYINMWLNRNQAATNQGLLNIGLPVGTLNVPPPWVYGAGDPRYGIEGTGRENTFEHKIWQVSTLEGLVTTIGRPNYFEIALDQGSDTRSQTRNNYLLSTFTIQPLDIRIEAIMYAQERSFFIIPGNWFNQNPNDVPVDPNNKTTTIRPRGVAAEWPFYREPLDTKITIDGAITENLPASSSDVAEWYQKWSNIPATYGSSGTATNHPPVNIGGTAVGDGLTFLYDETLGWPLYDDGSGIIRPVRRDAYGRALPITPRLPVCKTLIYYGEPT
jgi:hypothetical protein